MPEEEGNVGCLTIETRMMATGTIMIRVTGDICGDGADRLRRTVADELTDSTDIVVLDLRQVTRIDARGIDTLHSAAELTGEEDIGLCLVAPAGGAVTTGLAAVKSVDVFEIYSSVTEALRRCPALWRAVSPKDSDRTGSDIARRSDSGGRNPSARRRRSPW